MINPLYMLKLTLTEDRNFRGICSIEGNIGAGKSTVMKMIEERYPTFHGCNMIYVQEPSDRWQRVEEIPLSYLPSIGSKRLNAHVPRTSLDLFYQDKEKNAFPFQVHAFTTRTAAIWNAIGRGEEMEEPYALVIERSTASDRYVFVDSLIEEGSFPIEWIATYDAFWNLCAGLITPHIKAFVHLYTPPPLCQDRISKRDRKEECSIPLSYLERLDRKNKDLLKRFEEDRSCTTIDWSKDMKDEKVVSEMFRQFEKVLTVITK